MPCGLNCPLICYFELTNLSQYWPKSEQSTNIHQISHTYSFVFVRTSNIPETKSCVHRADDRGSVFVCLVCLGTSLILFGPRLLGPWALGPSPLGRAGLYIYIYIYYIYIYIYIYKYLYIYMCVFKPCLLWVVHIFLPLGPAGQKSTFRVNILWLCTFQEQIITDT